MTNRWTIAAAGFLVQVALGAVYAWSVIRLPLTGGFLYGLGIFLASFSVTGSGGSTSAMGESAAPELD